ncbi:MAG: hypothetical protein LPK92_01710, partial [Actinomycetes bacterium]|nr:hypothetical protein [Actinomycetes bacterium]
VADHLIEAVRLVARDGWRLLGDYRFDPLTGLWHHRGGVVDPPASLLDIRYGDDGAMTYPHHDTPAPVAVLAEHLAEARRILAAAPDGGTAGPATAVDWERVSEQERASEREKAGAGVGLGEDFEKLRWFELPPGSLD